MAEPEVREPETTWGFIRALIQAGTGVAFVLEEMPRIGTFLFVVAACTVVYEAIQWRRARLRRRDLGTGELGRGDVERTPLRGRRSAGVDRSRHAGRTATSPGN